MATDFYIVSNNNIQKFQDVAFKGAIKSYSFDFNGWADDNNDVTSVAWEVSSGSATIAGEALASNVASARVTFGQSGGNIIKITATTSAEKYVVFLDVLSKDIALPTSDDYGFCG